MTINLWILFVVLVIELGMLPSLLEEIRYVNSRWR